MMRVFIALLIALGLTQSAVAQEPEPRRWFGLSPFEMQRFVAAERAASNVIRSGNIDAAIKAYDQLVTLYPKVPRVHVNRAIVLALAGQGDEAVSGLTTGAELGFSDFEKLQNEPAMAQVMQSPQIKALLADLPSRPRKSGIFPPAKPAIAANNRLEITEDNVDYLPKSDILLIRTAFPKSPFSRAVAVSDQPWATYINQLYARGLAAGNHGDVYENRDKGHSKFKIQEFPQVTQMSYAPGVDAIHRLSEGPNLRLIADTVVFGNSSTAFTQGPMKRSLVRWAMTQPGGAERLFTQHRANQLYVYPEVQDFEAEYDRFPGYFADQIISMGRSGSDRIPMKGIALALAAFKPTVKVELKKQNLVAPVVTSILRRALAGGDDPLSDLGQRTVIDGAKLDLMKVIDLAQSMKLTDIPPRVVISVLEEPNLTPGVTVFAPVTSEAVYTTPTSVARRAHGTMPVRQYRLRAAIEGNTVETYHWRILAGDTERIRIEPLDARAEQIRLTIPWHDPFVTAEGDITTRVDVGAFVKAGANWSNPAVFSLDFPQNQTRIHDAQNRLVSITYNDPAKKKVYADPLFKFVRNWRDEYVYHKGVLEGWNRIQGNRTTRYSASGDIVLKLDALGRPVSGKKPEYKLDEPRPAVRRIRVNRGKQSVQWRYAGPDDRIGERLLVP